MPYHFPSFLMQWPMNAPAAYRAQRRQHMKEAGPSPPAFNFWPFLIYTFEQRRAIRSFRPLTRSLVIQFIIMDAACRLPRRPSMTCATMRAIGLGCGRTSLGTHERADALRQAALQPPRWLSMPSCRHTRGFAGTLNTGAQAATLAQLGIPAPSPPMTL